MSSGNWHLVVCGISHKTSTLEERSPLSVGREDLAAANAAFNDLPDVIESCILSTCNRVEFYFVTRRKKAPLDVVHSFYQQHRQLNSRKLSDRFYAKRDRHATAHLLRVAGGLDSMVLGENQILGQVREAYSSACSIKSAGKVIHRLFHQAFRVGKQIRTDTEMGKGACSVSSASLDLLRTKVNGLPSPSVLFVGVNKMIDLSATNLSQEPHGDFYFANRTREKAERLAERFHGHGGGLEELPQFLAGVDIVVTCTGAEQPIITASMLAEAVAAAPRKRLVIMDMAIPRDVEDIDGHCSDIEVYDLEDVRRFLREHQEKREAAVPQAELIVEHRLGEFMYWFDHVRHELISTTIDESFDSLRRQELAGVIDKLPPDLRAELEESSKSLVQKLLRVTARTCSKCSTTE